MPDPDGACDQSETVSSRAHFALPYYPTLLGRRTVAPPSPTRADLLVHMIRCAFTIKVTSYHISTSTTALPAVHPPPV